ncbi:MAG: hypothetical protein COV44_10560 [Deltaproteobacteria bacterium CG11_big_fil_rev_8_21_14_0_20_45_16]|nr:MAG: hypothetical protein COV44_10560 [Deltaproteobacteria bacterium CG11_big_fil_rev_8_21_14_0_20_45_16]
MFLLVLKTLTTYFLFLTLLVCGAILEGLIGSKPCRTLTRPTRLGESEESGTDINVGIRNLLNHGQMFTKKSTVLPRKGGKHMGSTPNLPALDL